MKFLGILLFVVGLLSLLLPLAGAGLIYLQWAERWGRGPSFAIRGGMLAVGALLWYLNRED